MSRSFSGRLTATADIGVHNEWLLRLATECHSDVVDIQEHLEEGKTGYFSKMLTKHV